MSYKVAELAGNTILANVQHKRTLKTDFKSNGTMTEQLQDIHHLI